MFFFGKKGELKQDVFICCCYEAENQIKAKRHYVKLLIPFSYPHVNIFFRADQKFAKKEWNDTDIL